MSPAAISNYTLNVIELEIVLIKSEIFKKIKFYAILGLKLA